MQNLQAEEGTGASLRCELSEPRAVVWSKGGLEVQADGRREPRQQGCLVELVLRDLRWEDAGEYTCTCGSQATSATVTVTGGPQDWALPSAQALRALGGPLGCSPVLESNLGDPGSGRAGGRT